MEFGYPINIPMKKDIENRTDIELLVNLFYSKVLEDKQLEFIFEEMAKINWKTHLPGMYNFWENIILQTGVYEGNPMSLHQHLHHITPLNGSHFDKWNQLFIATVDELFEGKNANLAKERAISISDIIREKISAKH
jgi:hemoglobin